MACIRLLASLALPCVAMARKPSALALATRGIAPPSSHGLPQLAAVEFSMSQVALEPGSLFETIRDRNYDYLINLDNSRLMCLYTSAANLTGTFANPTCQPYDHPQYWGHYLGHWLSATAQQFEATGRPEIRAKAAAVVAELAIAQQAWGKTGQTGFLFPYSIVSWDNLFSSPPQNCAPVCVPFYVFHKMLAGMLDQYNRAGNEQALTVARGMGDWAKQAVEGVLAKGGQQLWQEVLGIEWGGMNDGLFNLYAATGDADYLTAAYYFNHWSWTSPLAIGEDDLGGNHANTHIPEVIGDARGFELTGNATKQAIATNFFDVLTHGHTFVTGGSNDHEFWGPAHQLGDQMNADTEESCTTYNVLKVARHLYTWTANSTFFDFFDRALWNGIVGNQDRDAPFTPDTNATGFIYMLPIGGGGLTKPWGASNQGFPCCWGTLSEQFSKLQDSIYFSSPDNTTLFVNLFVPSTLTWPQPGGGAVTVTQNTSYPTDPETTTVISVAVTGAAATFDLNIRVPFWADRSNSITVNGVPFPNAILPGQYVTIRRTWAAGTPTVVSVSFEAYVRWEQIDDSRPAWVGYGAVLYGNVLLAGLIPTDSLNGLNPADVEKWVVRNESAPAGTLSFNVAGPCGAFEMVPLYTISSETYTVHFRTSGTDVPPLPWPASGVSTIPAGPSDFLTNGGASIVGNGPTQNIRSGDPGDVSTVMFATGVQDATHFVTGLEFDFQYVAGYGPAGAPGGTNFTLSAYSATACSSAPVADLWSSPVLANYSYDACNTCYSPLIHVSLPPGSFRLPAGPDALLFGLVFQDNDRNLQINLPLNLTVYWSS